MRLIVAGGRDFDDYHLLKETLDNFQQEHGNITEVVSGTAKGVDKSLLYTTKSPCKGALIDYFKSL